MTSVAVVTPKKPRKIPDYLIKEVLDGKPVYYKGYKAVLRKEKTLEDIMGASSLQIFIIYYIYRVLSRALDEKLHYVFTGEPGLHIDTNNNFSGDIVIYERKAVTHVNVHYFKTPPIVNIEVDVNIDNTNFTDFQYISRKTNNLLAFGTQKVIWVLTKVQKVIVAETDKDWLVIDWYKDIEIFNGITFNIPDYLKQEGIEVGN
ncbi:MAG: Uma2 family endonuclease [Spirosomaceae bacterium]|jgi:hypothetical protein|nr:Uma2 family endonuclease [Spirosomataceae bacterium]